MNVEYVTLDKLGIVSRGKSKHRPRNDASLFGGRYPFIQTADVKNASFYITQYSDTYNERDKLISYLAKNDLNGWVMDVQEPDKQWVKLCDKL